MPNQQLLDYIKDCSDQGFSQEKIKEALLSASWTNDEINEAFKYFSELKEEKNGVNLKQKNINKLKYLAIISVAVFIIFGLALSYNHYFSKPSFAKVITKSVNSLEQVNSMSYQIDFDISLKSNEFTEKTLSFIGVNDDAYFKINIGGDLDLELLNNAGFFNINTNTFGEELSLFLESRKINDNIYIKVNNLPEILAIFIPDIIVNKWLKIDTEDMLSNRLSNENRNKVVGEMKKIIKEEDKNIVDIFVVNKEEIVIIDKQEMYYYNLSVDSEKFINLALRLNSKMNLDDENIADFGISQEEIDELIEEMNNNSNLDKIEIWINKNNYYPHKINVQLNNRDFNTLIEISFSNFNTSINISEPEEFLSSEEIKELMDSLYLDEYNEGAYWGDVGFDDADLFWPFQDEFDYIEKENFNFLIDDDL